MPCSGDADQICGGSYAMSIYKYGDAFDFLGCFGDSVHARVLSGAFKNDSAMTTKVRKPAIIYIYICKRTFACRAVCFMYVYYWI